MKNAPLIAFFLLFFICPFEGSAMETEALGWAKDATDGPTCLKKRPNSLKIKPIYSPNPDEDNAAPIPPHSIVRQIPFRVQAFQVGKDVLALLARVALKFISFQVPFVKPCVDAVLDEDEVDAPQNASLLSVTPPSVQQPGVLRRAWTWCVEKTGSVWGYITQHTEYLDEDDAVVLTPASGG